MRFNLCKVNIMKHSNATHSSKHLNILNLSVRNEKLKFHRRKSTCENVLHDVSSAPLFSEVLEESCIVSWELKTYSVIFIFLTRMEVRADLGMILSQLKVTQFLMFQVSENVSRVVTVGHGSLLHNNCDALPPVQ